MSNILYQDVIVYTELRNGHINTANKLKNILYIRIRNCDTTLIFKKKTKKQ